ncbi:hypothetical protein ABK040_012166 [Willaertia magna]
MYIFSSDDDYNFAIDDKKSDKEESSKEEVYVKKENVKKEKRKRIIPKVSPQKKKVDQILAPLGLNSKLSDAKEIIKKALDTEKRIEFEGIYERILKIDHGLKKIMNFSSMPNINNVDEVLEFKRFLRTTKNMNYLFVHALYNLFILDLRQKKFNQKDAKEYYLNNDYYQILGYQYSHFLSLERVADLIDAVPALLFYHIDEETFSGNNVALQQFIEILSGAKFDDKIRFLSFVKSINQKNQIDNSILNNLNFYAIIDEREYGVAFGKLIGVSKEGICPSVDLDIFITRSSEYHIGIVKEIPLFKIKIIRQTHQEYLNLERVYNRLKK